MAAWKQKPNFYIVADQDRMIDPELEKKLAEQMPATDEFFAPPSRVPKPLMLHVMNV